MNWNSIIDKDWTLFLDRDGVINERIIDGYVQDINEFVFLPGVFKAFRIFARHFNHIIIVTNQQGVGKGLMKMKDVESIHDFMIQQIENQGGRVDAIYVCTQLKSEQDNFRKPNPQMAFFAKNDYPDINLSKSIMVGDTNSDLEFGINAGMKTILIGNEEVKIKPDDHFKTLYEFAKNI